MDADKVENIGTMLKSLIELKRPTGEGGGAIGARHIFEAEDDDFERTTVGEEVEVEVGDGKGKRHNLTKREKKRNFLF